LIGLTVRLCIWTFQLTFYLMKYTLIASWWMFKLVIAGLVVLAVFLNGLWKGWKEANAARPASRPSEDGTRAPGTPEVIHPAQPVETQTLSLAKSPQPTDQ